MRRATFSARLAAAAMIAGLAACTTIIDPVPSATVDFLIDAPLCSSRIPMEFMIDSTIVGTDTFLVHLGTEHMRSRTFMTSPGPHTLYARLSPTSGRTRR